jgi:hypothetical protein
MKAFWRVVFSLCVMEQVRRGRVMRKVFILPLKFAMRAFADVIRHCKIQSHDDAAAIGGAAETDRTHRVNVWHGSALASAYV